MVSKRNIEFTDDFKQFWHLYPERWIKESDRHVKIGKYEAWQVWRSMSKREREIALIAVRYMRPGQYVPDAHRWLRKKRYLDFEEKIQQNIKKKQVGGFKEQGINTEGIVKDVPRARRDDEPIDFQKVRQTVIKMKGG